MSDTSGDVAKVSLGKVISGAFAVIGRNFRAFGVFMFLISGLPPLVLALFAGLLPQFPPAFSSALGFAVGLLAIFAQGGIMQGVLNDAQGRQSSVAELLTAGRKVFARVFVVNLVAGLGVILGVAVLVAPGLILAAMWAVAAPAAITSDRGVGFALERSSKLTKGNRWRILGLFLVFMVVFLLMTGASVALTLGSAPAGIGAAIVQAIAGIVQTLFVASGATVLYLELDRIKGGMGGASLAATFD